MTDEYQNCNTNPIAIYGLGTETERFLNENRGMVIANTKGDRPDDGWIGVFSDGGHYIVLTHAEGTVRTPRGDIQVSWRLENGEMQLQIVCEDSLKADIITK